LEDVPNRENEFGRRVLRPALAAVMNDFASRLHQAIILSSEQHATDPQYIPLPRPDQFIYFLPPKYF
jgi:hypothetical protein